MKPQLVIMARCPVGQACASLAAVLPVLVTACSTSPTPPPPKEMAPAPSSIAAAVAKITTQPRYAHSTWGIAVADLKPGEVLFEQNGGKMFLLPAGLSSPSWSG